MAEACKTGVVHLCLEFDRNEQKKGPYILGLNSIEHAGFQADKTCNIRYLPGKGIRILKSSKQSGTVISKMFKATPATDAVLQAARLSSTRFDVTVLHRRRWHCVSPTCGVALPSNLTKRTANSGLILQPCCAQEAKHIFA